MINYERVAVIPTIRDGGSSPSAGVEVSVSVWPKVLKEMCEKRNIRVLE